MGISGLVMGSLVGVVPFSVVVEVLWDHNVLISYC